MSDSFAVYISRSEKDGKFYTGHTNDLRRRYSEHKRGHVRSTRNRRPPTLVHVEYFQTKVEAYARERYFKSLVGGPLKKLLVSKIDIVL
jgi:putative endonuclease